MISIATACLILAGIFAIDAMASRRERKQLEALFKAIDERRERYESRNDEKNESTKGG